MKEGIIDHETASPIEERCWYQPGSSGGRYWHQNETRWIYKNASQFNRWALTQGLKDRIPDEEKGSRVLSEIDELLTVLETHRIIDYAGGLAGWKQGVHTLNKSKILVTQNPDLIEPKLAESAVNEWDPGANGFPLLGKFLEGFFNGIEEGEPMEQLPRFLCWLWHFLESLYVGEYTTGLALALAGEPGSGKTLLTQLLQQMTGGIVARPYRYMIGLDNFNEEFLEASLLSVDDENSDTHIQSRLKFGAEIKQFVASRGIRIRAMHQKAIVLQPIQRIVICVNLEPERLQVLPPIDTDIRDKIMVLKGYYAALPLPTRRASEQEALWKCLMGELPYLIGWILEKYEPQEAELGARFGPVAWQHPAILEELGRLNPEARTEEFLERWIEKKQPRIYPSHLEVLAAQDRELLGPYVTDGGLRGWIGSVSDLRAQLVADGEEAPLSQLERREVRATAYLGRDLQALSRKYPTSLWQSRKPGSGHRNWIILTKPLESVTAK